MAVPRKSSQPRNVRFSTNFPELPAGLPSDVLAQLREWYDDLIGAMKDDHQTIEDAFAALHATTGTSDDIAKRILALEQRLTTIEANANHWPLIFDYHVAEHAEIKESKLALNYPTHSPVNDPTTGEKQALTGTFGAPSNSNRFVTESDPRIRGGNKRWFDVGDGVSSTITLAHNFGTRDVSVELYESVSGYRTTDVSVARTTLSTVDLEFSSVPGVRSFRALVSTQ